MTRFLIRWAINAIAIWLAIELVPGINHEGSILSLLGIALIFGLVNALVRPLLVVLTCPLIVLTLGLFTLIINAIMLWLTEWISSAVFDLGFTIEGFWPTLLGAIVITIVSALLNIFIRDDRE